MEKLGKILLALSIVLAFFLTMNMLTINSGFSESYNYTLTESEILDQYVTETCIKLQINSPECDLVYGGTLDQVSEGKIK